MKDGSDRYGFGNIFDAQLTSVKIGLEKYQKRPKFLDDKRLLRTINNDLLIGFFCSAIQIQFTIFHG